MPTYHLTPIRRTDWFHDAEWCGLRISHVVPEARQVAHEFDLEVQETRKGAVLNYVDCRGMCQDELKTEWQAKALNTDDREALISDPQLARELRAYATALSGRRDLAEDLVQDVLVKLIEGAPLPENAEKTRSYIYRMVRNLYLDRVRKAGVRRTYVSREKPLLAAVSERQTLQDSRLVVRDALLQLSPEHREILILIDVMGFSYAEAAEILDVARGTVMSRVSRARSNLADHVDQVSTPYTTPSNTTQTSERLQ